jgi:hypothetical protein
MTDSIQARFIEQLERELDRHCTDDELTAHASKQLVGKPVSLARLEAHLVDCLMCRARFALIAINASGAHQSRSVVADRDSSSAHWIHLGKVLFRSLPIEAGTLPDGTAFLHGASARETPLHLSASTQARQEWVVELPNNTSVHIAVRALEQSPALYELHIASALNPNVFFSLSQPAAAEAAATKLSDIDLSSERILRRGELGAATELQVEPGHWHLSFWSRVPDEPWTVVELILHETTP